MTEWMGTTLPDIPRLYTALAEWLACLLCILQLKRKMKTGKLILISVAALMVMSVFLELTGGQNNNFLWILCMMIAVGIMYSYICICCDLNPRDAAYHCVRSFVLAEFVASLEWQMYCYLYLRIGIMWVGLSAACLILIYGMVYIVIWLIYRKYFMFETEYPVTNKELISYFIIGLAVFMMSNLGFISANTIFGGLQSWGVFNARTLTDLGGIAIMYAYDLRRSDMRVRYELDIMQNILHNQYEQYQQSQESMELINYRYHDLKNHIIALKAEENAEKRNDYLDRMEEEIRGFEVQNKTGNEVLDTLLTSKNLVCMNEKISLTSVVDGSLFDFMDVMDICTIFGNALDNAIECEKKIADQEKRMIHVDASMQKSFLIISFENYCEEEPMFKDNYPVTTKEDSRFHGYGLKSLRYAVRKYDGETDFQYQDKWFHLQILIPR